MPPKPLPTIKIDIKAKHKNNKIIFDEVGEIVDVEKSATNKIDTDEAPQPEEDEPNDYFVKREKQRLKQKQKHQKSHADDTQTKWYNVYMQFPASEEVLDMKDNEQMELYNLCKTSYESEMPSFNKRNPADARWLQTAVHKGTAKDRANAGALLVTSNPLGNLEALSTLIGQTKLSNKSSTEVITILVELWKDVLLPPQRKLFAVQLRGADWKLLRKDSTLSNEQKRRIYAFWHFENELKELYFEFLKNLQQGSQMGQEHNKNAAIVAAAQLLVYAPEKEQMLLAMLVNKLGDPIAKVASKALHHLSEVGHRHPNMCGVIVNEAEKLLFRNNISERAQHFALCFLAAIAPAGRPDVCTKLVSICFALFKLLVQRGAVNNRTMQAILRCLQKAILEAKPAEGCTEILSKDMQDTVYRLVHLADVRVAVQTLGLLLQLATVRSEKSDRFFNALYKKMLDSELTNIGAKTASQLLHILHRAIHIDTNVARAQAFIKRLLQLALQMPAHMAAGCLIVTHKLLRTRKELTVSNENSDAAQNAAAVTAVALPKVLAQDEELAKFDSDGEEKYEDIVDDDAEKQPTAAQTEPLAPASSWHHVKVVTPLEGNTNVKQMAPSAYDAYHRAPAYAGAEFALRTELLLLREHYHPTVQVFADCILHDKKIDYYGDPLRDFGLPHFLERFAFKNPKKLDNDKMLPPNLAHKRYAAQGARGQSVHTLTKGNCTEDEMFIFNYLEQKRKQNVNNDATSKQKKKGKADEDVDGDLPELQANEVDDDEFENYLDGYFGKKALAAARQEDADEELDFLKELGGELAEEKNRKKDKKQQKKKSANDSDDDVENDVDADWGDDDDDEDDGDDDDEDLDEDVQLGSFSGEDDDISEDDDASIEQDDDDDDDASIEPDFNESDVDSAESSSDEQQMAPPKAKKARKLNKNAAVDEHSFSKKLKHSSDMRSLFAAADDFAELLEETGKTKGQGTMHAVHNKDKSSEKQMKWEEKRHSNAKTYYKTNKGGGKAKFSGKKRKH